MTHDIIITHISDVFGEYPGSVDVNHHVVIKGERDGFETTRVTLSDKVINDDGSYNHDQIAVEVRNRIGEMEVA